MSSEQPISPSSEPRDERDELGPDTEVIPARSPDESVGERVKRATKSARRAGREAEESVLPNLGEEIEPPIEGEHPGGAREKAA